MSTVISDVILIEQQCHACGGELHQQDIDEFEGRTDGTTDDLLHCPAHTPSYLTLCLECCSFYTVNLNGICRYCLESASAAAEAFASNGEQ